MTWRSTDALYDTALPIGTIDLAVSCVGNMRPAPTWEEFFGLHWDDDAMRREEQCTIVYEPNDRWTSKVWLAGWLDPSTSDQVWDTC